MGLLSNVWHSGFHGLYRFLMVSNVLVLLGSTGLKVFFFIW